MIKRARGEFRTWVEDVNGNEHEITVRYRGYSDPGRLYGPPENCYPPESEIELEYEGIPEGVDFGDLDAIHERIEEEAWEHFGDRDD